MWKETLINTFLWILALLGAFYLGKLLLFLQEWWCYEEGPEQKEPLFKTCDKHPKESFLSRCRECAHEKSLDDWKKVFLYAIADSGGKSFFAMCHTDSQKMYTQQIKINAYRLGGYSEMIKDAYKNCKYPKFKQHFLDWLMAIRRGDWDEMLRLEQGAYTLYRLCEAEDNIVDATKLLEELDVDKML